VGLGEEGAAALTRQHRLAADDLDGVGASPENQLTVVNTAGAYGLSLRRKTKT
jgi:hypothetical protein